MNSRFWTSYTSIRGKHCGTAAPAGDRVHVRGHSAGASVTPRARGDQDEFDVAMTTGNSQQGLSVHLGTVQGTPGGPRWVPAPARTHEDTGRDIDRIAFGTDAVPATLAGSPGPGHTTREDALSEISDALQDACADPVDTLIRIEMALWRMATGSSGRPEDQAAGEPRPAGFRMDDAETLIVTAGELWEALGRQDPTGNLSELQVNLLERAADLNDDAMCGGG